MLDLINTTFIFFKRFFIQLSIETHGNHHYDIVTVIYTLLQNCDTYFVFISGALDEAL